MEWLASTPPTIKFYMAVTNTFNYSNCMKWLTDKLLQRTVHELLKIYLHKICYSHARNHTGNRHSLNKSCSSYTVIILKSLCGYILVILYPLFPPVGSPPSMIRGLACLEDPQIMEGLGYVTDISNKKRPCNLEEQFFNIRRFPK